MWLGLLSLALWLVLGMVAVGQMQTPSLRLVPTELVFIEAGEQETLEEVASSLVDLSDYCADCGDSILHPEQYAVWIPHGGIGLVLELQARGSSNADIDLFVRAGSPVEEDPEQIYCTHASMGLSGQERVEIRRSSRPSLESGFYYVAIGGVPGAAVSFTLRGAIEVEKRPESLQDLDPFVPTEACEAYEAPDGSFRIDYPANWAPSVLGTDEQDDTLIVGFLPTDCDPDDICPTMEIARFPVQSGSSTLDQAFARMVVTLEGQGYAATAFRILELDGIPARGGWMQRMLPSPSNLQFVTLIDGPYLWIAEIAFPLTPLLAPYADAFDRVLDSWTLKQRPGTSDP
jgi:hypothetical protein